MLNLNVAAVANDVTARFEARPSRVTSRRVATLHKAIWAGPPSGSRPFRYGSSARESREQRTSPEITSSH